MAALVAWCVSPENALMTGQVLFADGGLGPAPRAPSPRHLATR